VLDQLFSIRNKNRYAPSTENYTPKMALERRTLTNCFNDRLAVLFSPWHGADFVYKILANHLEESGWSVLSYTFNPEILKADVNQVIESFQVLQSRIAADLSSVVSQNNFKQVHLIGSSLGNLTLGLVAEKFTSFDQATMIVPGSNIARSTWEGVRTQGIRKDFMKGMTEDKLDVAWDCISLKNHVKGFNGKHIRVVVSKTDRVIPPKYQYELLNALQVSGAKVDASYTSLGHYASIIKYCLSKPS
jgi:hypothetical protein